MQAETSGPGPVIRTALTRDDRKRLGARLRGLRAQHGLRIQDVAEQTQMAPNTVLAIERASYDVRLANLQAVALFFRTTIEALLAPTPPVVDPRAAELNDDHLTIAVNYRNARNVVRAAVEALLLGTASEALATLLPKLTRLPPVYVSFLHAACDDDLAFLEFTARVRERALADPEVTLVLSKVLDTEDRTHPLPKRRRHAAGPGGAHSPSLATDAPRRA